VSGLAEQLAARIETGGPLRFDEFQAAALYDPDGGFYATGGRAGRRGDFLTSAEVGPLFGAVVARALDTWWRELGEPDGFTLVDAGAGPGTLARAVLAARPACLERGRYVAVEVSAAQRAEHPDGVESRAGMPDGAQTGVILANELLDNLPLRLLVHDGGWREAFVGVAPGPRFVELLAPATVVPRGLPASAPLGSRAPLQAAAQAWLADALGRLERGRVVVVDYTSTTAAMAARPWREWLRTYRGHDRGGHYLAAPGSQDLTCEVALDQLTDVRPPDAVRTQAQWLALHGIDDLVEEGRRVWSERAATGDLAALRARSRIREAEALVDPAGLGSFTVAEWELGEG
jgi:SAM-dependent MidA family methyltransferase